MHDWFSHSWVLYLTALLPALGTLAFWSARRRRRKLAELAALPGLVQVRRGPRILRGLCVFTGLLLLMIGTAGPQWGVEPNPELSAGPSRDLVIVLDLSRSMLAETPSRQERARRALLDLARSLQERGGVRVALIVFAAQPRLVFPLTNDYDHLAEAVRLYDADQLPRELRPDPEQRDVSGTRIGAALRVAAESHDVRMRGAQDVLLLSDGDDPLDDAEWIGGADAARAQKIPVHTIGIGTADADAFIPWDADWLRDAKGRKIATRLREKPLQEIARQTGGTYIAAATQALPLGQIYRELVAAQAVRQVEDTASAAGITLYQQRYPWFLAGALVFLAATLVIPDRGFRAATPRLGRGLGSALVPLALLMISAAPPDGVDDLVRRANAAFAEEDYDAALKLYTQAEGLAGDPGLVAFNKAACLYRKKQYGPAVQLYRACLEDQQIPAERAARALYDLGNSLVQLGVSQGSGSEAAPCHEEAMDAYRRCLVHAGASPELRADAAHNLEIAKTLWRKAGASSGKESQPATKEPEQSPLKKQIGPPGGETKDKQGRLDKSGQPGADKKEGSAADVGDQKMAAKGLFSLPDQDQVVSLPPDAATALLDEAVRRIAAERRTWNRPAGTQNERVKDW